MIGVSLRRKTIPGLTQIHKGQSLLSSHRPLLSTIQSTIGVPEPHWRFLYLPMFQALAEFTQRLPASEAHHHCEEGGHLRHALESTDLALRIRRGHVLPPGKDVEEIALEQEVWTYAVASAALLHDVGKPLVDLVVTLHGKDGVPANVWSPWSGSMRECGGLYYKLEFRRDRQYHLHEAVSAMLAPALMPKDGLRWLSQHPDAMAAWVRALGCGSSGVQVIAEIVKEADSASAARDLAGDRRQVSGARAKPLAERLITALRHLLDTNELPMNRKGAAAFVTQSDVWLVSKRCLDAIRDSMMNQGQSGIPKRNDRLMDELQQRGVLIPNCEDRAIWAATVFVPTEGEMWQQSLTLLRVPIDQIWPNAEARPELLEVAVEAADAPAEHESSNMNKGTSRAPSGKSDVSEELLPGQGAESPGRVEPTFAGEPLQAAKEPQSDEPERDHDDAEVVALADLDDGPTEPLDRAPQGSEPGNDQSSEEDLGKAFVAWLVDGLKNGTLAVNTPKAKVHIVEEGMLLVSPAIFRLFAEDRWSHAQKRFLKLKMSMRTGSGENIFHYDVNGDRGKKTIKGILIDRPHEKLSVQLPQPNSVLSKKKET